VEQPKEPALRPTYVFGPFHLNPAERRLIRDDNDLRLPPKVFETLIVLVERHGLLVEKDDLMTALWPGTFVEEVTLARNISLLRKALGDASGQDQSLYIETVSKRGYRFIADVTEVCQPATQSRKPQQVETENIAHHVPEILDSYPQLLASQTKRFNKAARFAWAGIPIFALIVLVVGWAVLRSTSANSPRSIAVLPFVDGSNDASVQYITDGITEGVIDKLSEVPELKVISRNSAFRYKGKETNAQAVGRDLKVQAVLIGRIVQKTDETTISAELVNVRDGSRIWGRQFRYPISDLSRAQDELATSVLDKLKLPLNRADEARFARPATNNPEAYQLYLEARFLWNQRTRASIRKSVDLFQQAAGKDPNFALAYVGLADAYNIGNSLGFFTPQESMPAAKAAATKALVLDPRLAEAHAVLGQVKSHYDFDFPGAQREYLKAIELNPNYAYAHLYYAGGYLTPMGRHAEAIAEMKKALELDPLSPALNNYLGMTYLLAGDSQQSVQQFQRTIDLDPGFPLAHFFFASCLEESGKYEQAIEEVERGALLAGQKPEQAGARTAEYLKAFRTGGSNGYWQKNLEGMLKAREREEAGALAMARAYARVGNKEKALEMLQKAYEEREGNVTLVNSYPDFKSLRGDPRFSLLLNQIGLHN